MSKKRNEKSYSDFSNVVAQESFLTWEEFVEGPYGSPTNEHEVVENKETPWKEGQRFYSNYNFEDKSFHQDIPRQYPDSHPPHDDPDSEVQGAYKKGQRNKGS